MMNKKGGTIFLVIYLLIIIIAIYGIALQENPNLDISDVQEKFDWKYVEINVTSQPAVGEIVETTVNAVGEIVYSIVRWGANIAQKYPNVSWKWIIFLVIFAIIAPILVSLVKLSAILIILIKDFVQSRKEKRELKRLKENG